MAQRSIYLVPFFYCFVCQKIGLKSCSKQSKTLLPVTYHATRLRNFWSSCGILITAEMQIKNHIKKVTFMTGTAVALWRIICLRALSATDFWALAFFLFRILCLRRAKVTLFPYKVGHFAMIQCSIGPSL